MRCVENTRRSANELLDVSSDHLQIGMVSPRQCKQCLEQRMVSKRQRSCSSAAAHPLPRIRKSHEASFSWRLLNGPNPVCAGPARFAAITPSSFAALMLTENAGADDVCQLCFHHAGNCGYGRRPLSSQTYGWRDYQTDVWRLAALTRAGSGHFPCGSRDRSAVQVSAAP